MEGGFQFMTSRGLYRCPNPGCNQTSARRWNMNVHIKRRHKDTDNLTNSTPTPISNGGYIPVAMGFGLTRRGFSTLPYDYRHKTYPHHTRPINTDLSQEKVEVTQDRISESFREITELGRLMMESEEFWSKNSKNSITTTIQSQILALVTSSTLQRKQTTQRKHTTPVNNTKLPTGYRISVCDKCLKYYKLDKVFNPIEIEGLTKPIHGCDHNCLVDELGHTNPQNNKNPEQIQSEGTLTQVVFSRIGQGDTSLKVIEVPEQFFIEEKRRGIKLPPNRSLIEEKDCIEIDSKDNKTHWFWRAIKQYSNRDKIKLTREELKDFLSMARSTSAVFRSSSRETGKKWYFLMYLSL